MPVTNLPSASLRAPMTVLAPATEFITVVGGEDAGMPQAVKMRMGTAWLGLKGTFGTITEASVEHLGDEAEQPSGAPGLPRSIYWIKPGFKLSLTVHHDRGLPGLRKGDRIAAWVDAGGAAAVKLEFHVNEITAAKSDSETATLQITATHRKGIDDVTGRIRAEVDELGRVISYETALVVDAAVSDPAGGLPTAPAA